MKLLITRPISAAREMKETLLSKGHEVLVSPLLEISFRPLETLDLQGVQGVIVSSLNGADAFSRLTENRTLPIYAVGEKSADAAQKAGFKTVLSADGDVHDLARLIKEKAKKDQGALLHAGGARLAGDLKGELEAAGYTYRREILYDAYDVSELAPKALAALKAGDIDGILLFSPHTAKVLKQVIDGAKLEKYISNVDIWCLSQNVADALAGLSVRALHVADKPTEAALLDLIEQKAATTGQGEQNVAVPPSGKKDDGKSSGKAPASNPSSKTEPVKDDPAKAPQKEAASSKTSDKAAEKPASSTSAAEKPKPAEAPKSGGGKALLYGVGGAFLLGLVAWPALLPVVAPVLPEGATRVLKGYWPEDQNVTALESRLAALEAQRGVASNAPAADATAITAAVKEMQAQLQETIREQQVQVDALKSEASGTQEAFSKLESRVEELHNFVSSLNSVSGGAANEGPAPNLQVAEIENLTNLVTALKDQIKDLQQAQAVTNAEVSSQKTEVSTLTAAVTAASEHQAAADANGNESLILLALGQIHRESRSDAPFAGALQQGLAVTPAPLQADLAALSDVAQTGAPTLRQLMDGFEDKAAMIVQAARLPASDTWYGKTLHNLASLVKFRRVDDTEGSDVDAIVARAEQALGHGDLGAAITALETLEGAAAEAATGWTTEAKKRYLIDQTLDQILTKVTAASALDAGKTQ